MGPWRFSVNHSDSSSDSDSKHGVTVLHWAVSFDNVTVTALSCVFWQCYSYSTELCLDNVTATALTCVLTKLQLEASSYLYFDNVVSQQSVAFIFLFLGFQWVFFFTSTMHEHDGYTVATWTYSCSTNQHRHRSFWSRTHHPHLHASKGHNVYLRWLNNS